MKKNVFAFLQKGQGLRMISQFYMRIYDIVSKIPEGQVATYGQIAFLAGYPHAARIVGHAMSIAPVERNLPCHRVVNREGKLSPEHVFGGHDIQRSMLEWEGITFKANSCIDMEKHLWKFYLSED